MSASSELTVHYIRGLKVEVLGVSVGELIPGKRLLNCVVAVQNHVQPAKESGTTCRRIRYNLQRVRYNLQRVRYNLQRVRYKLQRVSYNLQRVSYNLQRVRYIL